MNSTPDRPYGPRSIDRRRAVQLIADRALVEGVARGDATSVESLAHRYGRRLIAYFACRAVPRPWARRLARDVLAQAIQQSARYDSAAGLDAWMLRLAVRRARGAVETSIQRFSWRRHPIVRDLSPAELDWIWRTTRIDQIGFATHVVHHDHDEFHGRLASLPQPQREVLNAYYGAGESIEAIGRRVHRGEQAVRQLLDAGIAALAAPWLTQQTAAMADAATSDAQLVPLRHNFLHTHRQDRASSIVAWTGAQAAPDELALVANWLSVEQWIHESLDRTDVAPREILDDSAARPRFQQWLASAAAAALCIAIAATAWFQWDSWTASELAGGPKISDGASANDRDVVTDDVESSEPPAPADPRDASNSSSNDPAAATGGNSATHVSDDAAEGAESQADIEPELDPVRVPDPDPSPRLELEPNIEPAPVHDLGTRSDSPTDRPAVDWAAWRDELYDLAYARDWIAMRTWTSDVPLDIAQSPSSVRGWLEGLRRWGSSVARVEGNAEMLWNSKLALSIVQRTHDQPTYDVVQEYYAALEAEADADFQRLHRQFTASRYPGLIPWPADPELLVTAWGAAAMAAGSRPAQLDGDALLAARIDAIRRLKNADPSDAWELARLYGGTPASGRVYEWFAQRDAQALRIDDARHWIRRAIDDDPDHAKRWQAWLAALETLEGRRQTRPPSADAWADDWGPPEVFPAHWVTESATARPPSNDAAIIEPATTARMAPVAMEPTGRPVTTGLAWVEQPVGVDALEPSLFSWTAHIGDDSAGGGTTASERICLMAPGQLAGFDPLAARTAWQYDAPVRPTRDPVASAGHLVRPPMVDGDRVVATLGNQCYCLDRDSGRLLWRTLLPTDTTIVSAPVLRADRYSWLALVSDQSAHIVRLIHLDPFTGHQLASHDLFRLRSTFQVFQHCELIDVGPLLVATWGGAVSVCDLDGHLYWVRETMAVPPSIDPVLARVARQAPLADATRVWTWQPGVAAVDCLDVLTGQRVWRRTLPDLQRLVGATDRMLVFQLRGGLTALDRATGAVVWNQRVRQEWAPSSWTNDAGQMLVFTHRPPAATAAAMPVWSGHWIDMATGRLLASWTLNFEGPPPRLLGPLMWGGGRLNLAGVPVGESEWSVWQLSPKS